MKYEVLADAGVMVSTVTGEVAAALTKEEARALTDEVVEDARGLWVKLLRLYNGGAHTALGHKSWAAYCAHEFRDIGERSRSYRLLAAAKVLAELEPGVASTEAPQSPIGDSPLPANEGVARELAPTLKTGDTRERWAETLDKFGPEPTAAEVRSIVKPPPDPPPAPPSWAVRAEDMGKALLAYASQPPESEMRDHALLVMNLAGDVLAQIEGYLDPAAF